MLDVEHLYWREILVNLIFSMTLTLKMCGIAPSLTFLSYYLGLGAFALFTAGFNTDKHSWADFKTCHATAHSVTEVFNTIECQEILMPSYLTALGTLCVAFASIEGLVLMFVATGNLMWMKFYAKDRRADLQVLRLDAKR